MFLLVNLTKVSTAAHSMYFSKVSVPTRSPLILVTAPELPASFTPTSNGFVEDKSLLVVYGFYFFPTFPSGPPWNEGHQPRVRHETSVLEVPVPGTTRTLLLFKFY